jgi:hypothetical protein
MQGSEECNYFSDSVYMPQLDVKRKYVFKTKKSDCAPGVLIRILF